MERNLSSLLIAAIANSSPEEVKAVLTIEGEDSGSQVREKTFTEQYEINNSDSLVEFFNEWKSKPEKAKKILVTLHGDPFIEMLKKVTMIKYPE